MTKPNKEGIATKKSLIYRIKGFLGFLKMACVMVLCAFLFLIDPEGAERAEGAGKGLGRP